MFCYVNTINTLIHVIIIVIFVAKAPVSTIDKTMELFVSSVTLPADIVPTLPLKAGKENWLVYIDTSASTGNCVWLCRFKIL